MNNNKYFETIRVSDGCGRYHDEKQPRYICETCKYGPDECAKSDTVCYSGKINWRCWESKFDNEELYETITNWTEDCGGHYYKEKQLKHICKTCAEGPDKCVLYRDNHICWIDPFCEANMKRPHVVNMDKLEKDTQEDLMKYGLIDTLEAECRNIEGIIQESEQSTDEKVKNLSDCDRCAGKNRADICADIDCQSYKVKKPLQEPLEVIPTEPLIFEKPEQNDKRIAKWDFYNPVNIDGVSDKDLGKVIRDSIKKHMDTKNWYYTKSKIDRIESIDKQLEELIDKTNALQEEKQVLIDTLNPLEFLYMKYELAKNYVLNRVDYEMLVKIYKALDVKVATKEPEKALRKEIEEPFDDLLEDTLQGDGYKSTLERQFENGTKCNLFIILKIKIISKDENVSLFTSIQNKSFNVECTLSVRPISTGIVK